MKIKNKTAGHAGIACFSFALKGNRAGSPHFKIVRFKWWEHVTMCVAEEAGEYVVQINSTYNYADKYPSERAAEDQMLRIAHARNAIEEELRNY